MAHRRPDIVTIKPVTRTEEWAWFHSILPVPLMNDARGVIAYINNEPAAMTVFQRWYNVSAEVHWVIRRPIVIKHGWFEAIGQAGFGDKGRVIYGMIAQSRPESLRLAERVGFQETGRIPDGDGPGSDLIIVSATKQDYKY